MVSTFINPVINPDRPLGMTAFVEAEPVRHQSAPSASEVDMVVRAIYKQVLSNAYVMESERQRVPESQFRLGELNVMEFIRQVAKSDLYRSRFFENGPRNRFIELNFKHFLGRAPESLDEIAVHSAILDSDGYEAEIDSYLDSEEYYQSFGPDTVPFYRGYKTEASTPAGFTHMFSLLRGPSSSDKQAIANNPARLIKTLFADQVSSIFPPSGAMNRQGFGPSRSVNDLLNDVFSRSTSPTVKPEKNQVIASSFSETSSAKPSGQSPAGSQSQSKQIEQLQAQLDELRSLSNMGAAILRKGQSSAPAAEAPLNADASFNSNQSALSNQKMNQAQQIEKLQNELMAARSLSTIAEFKLNKWRRRSY